MFELDSSLLWLAKFVFSLSALQKQSYCQATQICTCKWLICKQKTWGSLVNKCIPVFISIAPVVSKIQTRQFSNLELCEWVNNSVIVQVNIWHHCFLHFLCFLKIHFCSRETSFIKKKENAPFISSYYYIDYSL